MIDVFVNAYPYPVEIVDTNNFPYEAGCHGCLRCELVGVYDRKDGFQEFYFNLVNSCDVLVFGMNIDDFPQKDVPKQLFNLGMGIAFKAKPVRLQAWKRMPKLYFQLHKNIVDSGRR